ncbi:MAG: methyltransferase domain-containing protein [Polyangiaceae bacterium]
MTISPIEYVHGYSSTERERLIDQAATLEVLLHHDTRYSSHEHVLEAGCGVGAQTVILAEQNPATRFTSIDIERDSIEAARQRIAKAGHSNVEFQQGDLYDLSFADESFDHVFLCFVLEHLTHPERALSELRRVLRWGGTITAIEGDHGSAYYYPRNPLAQRTIECLIRLQSELGGDPLIGRRLYPLLRQAGFDAIRTEPRPVYADASRPDWVEGFTKATFIAMVEGVRDSALARGLMTEEEWAEGISELRESTGEYGTFSYTFFKASAKKALYT